MAIIDQRKRKREWARSMEFSNIHFSRKQTCYINILRRIRYCLDALNNTAFTIENAELTITNV
jgi:hypothetical protein